MLIKTKESINMTLKDISTEKAYWFETTRKNGKKALVIYAKTEIVTPDSLDDAFNTWKVADESKRATELIIAYGLGVLFGDFIISKIGGSWKETTDGLGSGLAIELKNGMVAYPIDSILKRIPPNEHEISFFEPIWHSINNNA